MIKVYHILKDVKLPVRVESVEVSKYRFNKNGTRPAESETGRSFEEMVQLVHQEMEPGLMEWNEKSWMALLNCIVALERYRVTAFMYVISDKLKCGLCGSAWNWYWTLLKHVALDHGDSFNEFEDYLVGELTITELSEPLYKLVAARLVKNNKFLMVSPSGERKFASVAKKPTGRYILNPRSCLSGRSGRPVSRSRQSGSSPASSSSSSSDSSSDDSSDSSNDGSSSDSDSSSDQDSDISGDSIEEETLVPVDRPEYSVIEKPLFA